MATEDSWTEAFLGGVCLNDEYPDDALVSQPKRDKDMIVFFGCCVDKRVNNETQYQYLEFLFLVHLGLLVIFYDRLSFLSSYYWKYLNYFNHIRLILWQYWEDDRDVSSKRVAEFRLEPLVEVLLDPKGDFCEIFEMFLTSLSFRVVFCPAFRALRASARHLK